MQLELFDGPPSRNLAFFAITPPQEVAVRLADFGKDFSRRHRLTGSRHRPERLHISLWGTWLHPRSSAALTAEMTAVGAEAAWPAFDVALTRAMSFGRQGRRPLVLTCGEGTSAALEGLHDRLFDAAAMRGLPLRRRAYVPHLTLGYDRAASPETLLEEPVVWTARELVLIRSEQGRGRHIPLGSWPLG
jgi:2'-5' RNA ligase